MAAKATFDLSTLTIILDQVAPDGDGKVEINVQVDLYSDAKETWLASTPYPGFEFPFTTIGGEDLGGSREAGDYYFLRTDLGWRIQPYEADHEVTLVGNLYPTVATDQLTVPVSGAYTVGVFFERSQLTQTATFNSGSGLDTTQNQQLTELHQIFGLESGSPLHVTASTRTVASVAQTITGDPASSTVVTRT